MAAAALKGVVNRRSSVRPVAVAYWSRTSPPLFAVLRRHLPPQAPHGAPFHRGAAPAAAPFGERGRDDDTAGAIVGLSAAKVVSRMRVTPSGCHRWLSLSRPTSASEASRGRATAGGMARPLHLKREGAPGGDTKDDGLPVQVPPPPTWSVGDLRLSSPDGTDDGGGTAISSATVAVEAEVTDQDLRVLAGRCLIDVPDDPSKVSSLRRGVGEMMRCLSVVTEAGGGGSGSLDSSSASVDIGPEEMYDLPRGVNAPTRGDDHRCSSVEESRRVLGAVRHKQVEVGGQLYFTTPAPGLPVAATATVSTAVVDSSNSDED